jgi:hypothetical protein
MLEALIDFGEGEDLEEGLYEQGNFPFFCQKYRGILNCAARERVLSLRRTIQSFLLDRRRGEILRSGIRLAIFGPPNAGKSSLLNFLGTSIHSVLRISLNMMLKRKERLPLLHLSQGPLETFWNYLWTWTDYLSSLLTPLVCGIQMISLKISGLRGQKTRMLHPCIFH